MSKSRRHFESFDALRFFAFLKVFLLHIPISAFPVLNFFREGGEIGVSFFFVLSGFLITYIILEEKDTTGKLNLSSFFIRRILRIWPLYYLMVAIAFLTPYLLSRFNISYSNEGYSPNWLWTILFLENYKMIITDSFPNVSPLRVMWSLCVEEHFYIVWGLALWKAKIKHLPFTIFGAVCIAVVSRYFFIKEGWSTIDLLTNIDFFAYGAIPAFLLVRYKKNFEQTIENVPRYLKVVIVTCIIVFVLVHSNFQYSLKAYIEPLAIGIMFSLLISFTIPEKNAINIGKKNLLSFLGKFTYGLYLIHTLVLNLFIQLFKKWEFELYEWQNALFFILCSFMLSVGLAIGCYHFFELPFLRLKRFFYKVKGQVAVSGYTETGNLRA